MVALLFVRIGPGIKRENTCVYASIYVRVNESQVLKVGPEFWTTFTSYRNCALVQTREIAGNIVIVVASILVLVFDNLLVLWPALGREKAEG